MTSVLSSIPRSARSRNSVDRAASSLGSSCSLSVAEIAVVRVPIAMIDGDAADAGLHQSARHEARLAERVAAVLVAQGVGLGVDVERLLGVRRGHQLERFALEDADGTGRHGCSRASAALLEAVHAGQQFLAVVEAGRVDDGRRRQVGHGEIGGVGVGVDDERGGGGAEIGRAGAGVHLGQADVGRHGTARPEGAGDDGAVGRPLVVGVERRVEAGRREIAGQHVVVGGAVVGVVMAEGADEGDLVHLPGHARQMFADADAGDVGVDGVEIAAELDRGVRLEVPRVDGAEAAVQEEEDERDIFRRLTGLGGAGAPGQQFRQRQAEAEDAGGPQTQEIAAGDAVAETWLNDSWFAPL